MFSKDSCCPYLVPFFSPLLESNHADLMYVVCPRLTIMQDFTLTFDRPFGVHTSRSYFRNSDDLIIEGMWFLLGFKLAF